MTEMNENCVIKIENLSKEYRLGAIGSGTLRHDLQSWYAKKRGKEDPNQRIGAKQCFAMRSGVVGRENSSTKKWENSSMDMRCTNSERSGGTSLP